MEHRNACLICGRPLTYFTAKRRMTCQICGETLFANACCEAGHFVCDSCHSRRGIRDMVDTCLREPSADPIGILNGLMQSPAVHMHGPEHHVLTGAALLTAYHNSGGRLVLADALQEMIIRGEEVPGGSCGFWGCCGAAISCGIFVSIVTKTDPLSRDSWGLCNLTTAKALERIAEIGGPRCCKRDSYLSILATAELVEEHLGVSMTLPRRVLCGFHRRNEECLQRDCPFFRVSAARMREKEGEGS